MIKKTIFLITLILLIIPFYAFADDITSAGNILDKYLQKERPYYKNGSVKLTDTKEFQADVTENGNTENRNIMAIFAKYTDVRDSIFYFHESGTYFYDIDNQKILDSSATINGNDASSFSEHYLSQIDTSLSAPSLILLMLSLFIGLFIIPIISVKLYKHA